MTVENKDIPEKDQNRLHPQVDKAYLDGALQSWSETKENTQTTTQEAKKIIEQLVLGNFSQSEIQSLLSKLPIDKRMQAEQLIIEHQRELIATMSQEKYRHYLQSQFPSGVPANISEMALSMVTDTSEMYHNVKQEIVKTGIDSSDHERGIRKKEQRIAINATQESEQATTRLSYELSHIG